MSDGQYRQGPRPRAKGRITGWMAAMTVTVSKLKQAMGGVMAAAVLGASFAAPVMAQETVGQEYTPTIWIDPDGCEHWVMDDGFEGFMSPHRNRDGTPVCHRSEICGIMPTDQLFATDRARVHGHARETLVNFFQNANAYGFLIYGHTDSRASDEYNMGLSERRANAVAAIAQNAGVNVVDVRGFGERMPRASNATAAGLQENRRVEIYCLR